MTAARVLAEPMLLVKGGRVLDPQSGRDEVADVLVHNNKILLVGPEATARAKVSRDSGGEPIADIDATGCWVTPGLIDIHVHFREPGHEYKEDISSGLRAAAAGGFSAVCAMPNTKPVNDTRAITEMMLARARAAGGARLYPIAAMTVGLKGEHLTEMADLKDAGAIGVSDDGLCVMNAAVMRRVMEYAHTFDMLVSQHCEDHHLTAKAQMHEGEVSTRLGLGGWPRVAEDVIVARDILLAELTGARYHVAHISSARSVDLVRDAKARGIHVTSEVTPHHLMLTDEALLGYDTSCKVNPPLREESDRRALREGLADGTIDCIATDHAPHSELEKDCEFAAASPGMIGLETTIPVLLELVRDGSLSPMRFIESLTSAPARIAKLPGGTLGEGEPADITIIDPELRWTVEPTSLSSRSTNTPFLHREVTGAVRSTIVDGNLVYSR